MPTISVLAVTAHGEAILRALGLARELDKGKGEAMIQDIYLPYINRGLS